MILPKYIFWEYYILLEIYWQLQNMSKTYNNHFQIKIGRFENEMPNLLFCDINK